MSGKLIPGSVFIAMPTHRPIEVPTYMATIETVSWAAKNDVMLDWQVPVGSAPIGHSRSVLVQKFLDSSCETFFSIDSDIIWNVSEFRHMLELSKHMPIVIGAYPLKKDPAQYALLRQTVEGAKINAWGCFQGMGIGMGFTVIQRRVLEHMAKNAQQVWISEYNMYAPYLFPYGVHQSLGSDKWITRTEDMPFLEACHEQGFQSFICPDVDLGHIGGKVYRMRLATKLGFDALGVDKGQPDHDTLSPSQEAAE